MTDTPTTDTDTIARTLQRIDHDAGNARDLERYQLAAEAVRADIPPAPVIEPDTQICGGLHFVTADELEEIAADLRAANEGRDRHWTVGVRAPRSITQAAYARRQAALQHPLFGARGKQGPVA